MSLLTSPTDLTLRYEVVEGYQDIVSARPLRAGKLSQLAIVYDASKRETTLYLDGEPTANAMLLPSTTEVIYGERAWLGRADGVLDATFTGRFEDLRVFSWALTACQVRAAYAAGPNAGTLCETCED